MNGNHADEVTDSTDRLKSRLTNWKFESAAELLSADDHTEAAELIHALAAQFGNCGHFDGEMGDLIAAVVELLLRDLSKGATPI